MEVADIPDDEARTQVAALCWRMSKGKPEILLITSRETGRWVIPKGWPMKGLSSSKAAAQEAWEEAGVNGKIRNICIGFYAYHKVRSPKLDVPCVVAVYPLRVKSLDRKFPEAGDRKRRWFTPKKAAAKVEEPELRDLLANFDPKAIDT